MEKIAVTVTVNAPREKVWQLFTERHTANATEMIKQLAFWAEAMRAARSTLTS